LALLLLLQCKITIFVLPQEAAELASSPESESVASGSEKEIRILLLRTSMPPILLDFLVEEKTSTTEKAEGWEPEAAPRQTGVAHGMASPIKLAA
jgi:hypothetical protein